MLKLVEFRYASWGSDARPNRDSTGETTLGWLSYHLFRM